jgi:hypothetical protein
VAAVEHLDRMRSATPNLPRRPFFYSQLPSSFPIAICIALRYGLRRVSASPLPTANDPSSVFLTPPSV